MRACTAGSARNSDHAFCHLWGEAVCHRIKYLCEACGCVVTRLQTHSSPSHVCIIQIITIDDGRSRVMQFSARRCSSACSSGPGSASHVMVAPPPAPAPPLPGAARRSCPWRGRGRWRWTGQHEPAPAGRSWRYSGTEAQVAVRLERAHAQLLGQGEGLLVGGCGLLDLQGSRAARRSRRSSRRAYAS